ncbi:S41 family peptidase [Spectribacter hydrogenoxidans]|uniref:S41 family peptidase n=1 Tax=Spectribacter hydrogenoxidans TaxID=3075608 RepID=A0ABU3BWW0_9GAMM|nr:S41 family peptidase [Salinisphaera sp. W335]MDT0633791.1 S41 family peptidase [Salinisphaera sp. W335]
MPRTSHSLLLLATGVVVGVLLALGQGVFATSDSADADNAVPLEDLRSFVEILNRVKQGYVEEVSDEDLLNNAIRGMLDGLDPHSAYLSPEEFKEINISTSGEFGGLGIEVTMENGFVRVVSPIDDTPAKKAGIEAGDLIIRIDDTAVKGMKLNDAVKLMRGEPGTDITLTVLRESNAEPFQVTITRDVIEVKSVRSRMLTPSYGYVRISQFSNQTGESLNDAMDELMDKADGDLRGLVLDLRNNPGGLLNAAVDVSDAFLTEGEIVSIDGRVKNADQSFSAGNGDKLRGRPLVVLVNQGSASASEIVAGALQDSGRAIIMGRRTFGKGSVQTIVPLQNDAALKLTTARYYTPDGRSIQAEGIVPDVEIQSVKVSASAESNLGRFSEADLAGALANGKAPAGGAEKANKAAADAADDDEDSSGVLAEEDYALYEALNLLKGLHIQSRR